jgi:magnesium transporter
MTTASSPATPELLYLIHGDADVLAEALAQMRSEDIATALRDLPPDAASKVMASLPFELAVKVFDEPELSRGRTNIVRRISKERIGPLIEAMSADQQADLFRELPERERSPLLRTLSDPARSNLQKLLQYAPETAAGIMTTEFLSVPSSATVEQTLSTVSKVASEKETVYAIYVVDENQSLCHVVSLRELMTAPRSESVMNVGNRRTPLSVSPETDREETARLVSRYDLLAIPVTDPKKHILGIVTVDDIIDTLVKEQTEDVQRFGGMEALDAPYMRIGFAGMVRKRAGWLCALFLSEMLTATAMQHFNAEIARATVLAMFIPLVMSSGGNSGSQATSLIIRALALREIHVKDWWRVLLREIPTGLTLGSILGVIGFIRIIAWEHFHIYEYGPHYLLVALTIGLSLIGIVAFGSLAGSMLPFLLKRIGFDPASASAPFVATLVDVTGLIIYFSVAYLILAGTLL